jgi:hypothetical protein
MTLGFWLYAIWFNPGQDFVYYLVLQERPLLAVAQSVAASAAHGVACAGLLLLVLRVPNDCSEPRWRYVAGALPAVAVVIVGMQLVSYANILGYPTEALGRATFFVDYAVDALAVWILLRRRHGHPPQEYQRMRWIIWGCLIGLPAYILSGILQSTSLWPTLSGSDTIPESLVSLLLLTYGIFGWFVFEALRRPRVINVSIPLRRLTVFGVLLSVPAVFADRKAEQLQDLLHLPDWAWLALASVLFLLLGRLHEVSAKLADGVFNRTFRRQEMGLREVGREILRADGVDAIEKLLVEAPLHQLDLASAAVFRREDMAFRRHVECPGWPPGSAESLDVHAPALSGAAFGKPFDAVGAEQVGFPHGLAAPTLAVPVRDKVRLFAVAYYGPHVSGADLATDERELLGALADDAASAYARAEASALRRQVADLQLRLSRAQSDDRDMPVPGRSRREV